LEVGDTLEVKWTVRGKNPEHGGQFFSRYTFGDQSYPVFLDEFRVRLPKDMPFHYAPFAGGPDPVRKEVDGGVEYVWKALETKQLPQDENLPSKEMLQPGIQCSTFASWEAVAAWKMKLRADSWASSPEIEKVVAEATKGLKDPAAKARALTYWMRRNIRYVSSGERHDYTPHLPVQVYNNRFGDCKDTSQMLAVMLKAAGVPVALATLGALDDGQIDEAVPSPWGTHAILVLNLPEGRRWIDTTLSLGGWDYLPRDDRDRLCYVVDERGGIRLMRTPPMAADDYRFEQTTDLRVDANGTSHCERAIIGFKGAALSQRDSYLETPVGERRRQVAGELIDSNSRARLRRLTFDEAELADFDKPVKAWMQFEIANHFTGAPEMEGGISDNKVWGRLLAFNIDFDREAPFELPTPFESKHQYVVHVPPGYAVESLPLDKVVKSRWGRFEIHSKADKDGEGAPRSIEINFLTRIDKPRVEPADFEEFRRFHDDVSKYYRVWLTLKPTQDLADAPLLEAALALAPDDGTSSKALAQLYEHNERLDEARSVLRRACFYRPNDVSLWELRAQMAGDLKEEESLYRELVRRFPTDARFSLALGNLLVQRGRQTQAQAVLEPLTKKGTPANRAQAHMTLARSFERGAKPQKALQHLTAAESVDADTVNSPEGRQLRARVLESLGKLHEAAKEYQKALAADRDAEEALEGLIRLSLAEDKKTEALDYLRRYTVVVGDEPTGLLVAAEYSYRLGRFDDALDLATRARERDPDLKADRLLGLVYAETGQEAKALESLEKVEEPDEAVIEASLRCALDLGRLTALPTTLEQADKIDQPTPEFTASVARAKAVLDRRKQMKDPAPAGIKPGKWSAALDSIACGEAAYAAGRTAVAERLQAWGLLGDRGPGSAFALRARIAVNRGRLTEALADADKAIRLSPDDGGGFYVRGRVERNEKTALDDLQTAARLSGRTDAEILHWLASGLFQAGKLQEAIDCQKEAVQLKPSDGDLKAQLVILEKATGPKGGE
jgi:tetratricopeptide (TPR) repeat protein